MPLVFPGVQFGLTGALQRLYLSVILGKAMGAGEHHDFSFTDEVATPANPSSSFLPCSLFPISGNSQERTKEQALARGGNHALRTPSAKP